ncbi:glutamate-gated chloride channel alpha-like [Homarus americanus]|uniref:glutamate-gated chloride channel alpha-like n=1 Tax=Homarus americanus TaxID=6706 RepID=UPI001C475DD3|nr:glutamate-gated chloride channel alpha-like [Homarus americanus]
MMFHVFVIVFLTGGVWADSSLLPDNYQKHIRPEPDGEGGGPLRVGVGWHVGRIHEVNINDMTVTMTVRVGIAWMESRMIYNGESHTGDHEKLLPLDLGFLPKIWKPDLFYLDTVDIKRFSMVEDVAGVWLMKNNTIYFSFLVKITQDCPMHFGSYPFDVQHCTMTLTSYEYNAEELLLYWLPEGVTTSHRVHSHLPGYTLDVLPTNLTKHHWCRNCLLEPSSAATSVLRLKRHFSAYLLAVYVPSSLLVAVAWVSFFWPPEPLPGRTALVITALLTLVSTFVAARQSSPETDYVKAIDVWFFVCLCLNVFCLFQFAVIITLRRRQKAVTPETGKSKSMIGGTAALVASRSAQNDAHLSRAQRWEAITELASKILLPIIFLLFNIIYWPYFLVSTDHNHIEEDIYE